MFLDADEPAKVSRSDPIATDKAFAHELELEAMYERWEVPELVIAREKTTRNWIIGCRELLADPKIKGDERERIERELEKLEAR